MTRKGARRAQKRHSERRTIPAYVSRAFKQFLFEESTLLSFSADYRREQVESLSDSIRRIDETKRWIESGAPKDGLSVDNTSKRRDAKRPGFMAEMSFARRIDNYLMYLQDLLALIYIQHPDRIGKIDVNVGSLMKLRSIEDLVSEIKQESVESITKKYRRDLFAALKRLGFAEIEKQRNDSELSEALKIRDQIVHRRGILGIYAGKSVPEAHDRLEVWNAGAAVRGFEAKYGPVENFVWNSIVPIDAESLSAFELEKIKIPPTKRKL